MRKFAAAVCLSLAVSTVQADADTLEGTRRGPTGWYLPAKERTALRERVKNDAWAKEFLDKEILPEAVSNSPLKPNAAENGLGRRGPFESALAYAATGDKKYGDTARNWLLYGAARWNKRSPDATIDKPPYNGGSTGNCAWGAPMAGTGNIPMHIIYDLAADTLSPEEEIVVRKAIKEIVDYACNWIKIHGGNPNMNFIALTDYYEWAASIGYETQMDWILNHKAGGWDAAKRKADESNLGGLLVLLDDYMNDGMIGKESPIYHTISLRVVGMGMAAWRYNGKNWFEYKTPRGNSLKGMIDGLVATAWPIMETGYYKGTVSMHSWGHGGTMFCGDIALVNRPSESNISYCAEGAIANLFRIYPDDIAYRYLLSLTARAWRKDGGGPVGPVVLDDWLHGPLGVKEDEPPAPAPSGLYPQAGIAMLRVPETGDYWTRGTAAWFHGGEYSRGHCADPSLMFFGAGRLLLPQFLTTQYEDPLTTGWCMARQSRNTVTIDGRQGCFSYSSWRRSFDPEVKFVSVRCHPYLEAEAERAGFLTDGYLLDFFHVQVFDKAFPPESFYPFPGVGWGLNTSLSKDIFVNLGQETSFLNTTKEAVYGPRKMPETHTFDYNLHGFGRQCAEEWQAFKPSDDLKLSQWNYRWAWNERMRETDGAACVEWIQTSANYLPDLEPGEARGWDRIGSAWFKGRAGVRTRILGEPGTKVFLADGPMRWGPVDDNLTPEEKIPFVAVRRTGKAAFFAAVHEPFKDYPSLRSFRYLSRPDKAAKHASVGVEVEGVDFTDRAYLTLGLPGEVSSQPGWVRPSEEIPLSTVSDEGNPSQGVSFRGQAYIRIKGGSISARGPVEAFCIHAPGVKNLILNGKPADARFESGYVLFGDGPWKPSAPPKKPDAQPPWTSPLQASLPQKYMNISPDEGGTALVRVDGIGSPVAAAGSEACSGRIELSGGKGLKVEPASAEFSAVKPGDRAEFKFTLKCGETGALLPLTVRIFVKDKGKERLAQEISTDVSVGVTVKEIPQQYDHPLYKDCYKKFEGDRKDNFDRFLVRAPGYTIEIDKFSGTSRSMIDPEGHERIGAAGYPMQFTRGFATFIRDVRDGQPRHPYEVPCVPGAPDKPKILGWWSEAKFLGKGTDSASGSPTLKFQTADGLYQIEYIFKNDAVSANFAAVGKDAKLPPLKFDGLCVDNPAYAYRNYIKDGREFGFRKGTYSAPNVGQTLNSGPYYSFRTCPKLEVGIKPQPGNILPGGGFEDADSKEGTLAGWMPDDNAKKACALDETVSRSGKRSLKCDLSKVVNPSVSAAVEMKSGRKYRLSLWTRCDGVKAEIKDGTIPQSGWAVSCFRFSLDRPDGWHTWNQFHPAFWPSGTVGEWQRVEIDLPQALKDGSAKLSICFHFGACQAGTVWVDDVELEEVE